MSYPDGSKHRVIRQERAYENFNRGLELIKAIRRMWALNITIPRSNQQIETAIDNIMAEFDLTISEWHYWADLATGEKPGK